MCDDQIVDELDDDVLRVAPIDLVANFRDALLAILPAADAAQLSRHDGNQHYEWERLAMMMFDVFVRQPVSVDQHRRPDEKPLAQYGIDRLRRMQLARTWSVAIRSTCFRNAARPGARRPARRCRSARLGLGLVDVDVSGAVCAELLAAGSLLSEARRRSGSASTILVGYRRAT